MSLAWLASMGQLVAVGYGVVDSLAAHVGLPVRLLADEEGVDHGGLDGLDGAGAAVRVDPVAVVDPVEVGVGGLGGKLCGEGDAAPSWPGARLSAERAVAFQKRWVPSPSLQMRLGSGVQLSGEKVRWGSTISVMLTLAAGPSPSLP